MRIAFGALIAVLAMLGVFLIFLFPANCGPFSVTHGPATAFRALAAALAVFAAITAALLLGHLRGNFHPRMLAEGTGALRCAAAPLALRC